MGKTVSMTIEEYEELVRKGNAAHEVERHYLRKVSELEAEMKRQQAQYLCLLQTCGKPLTNEQRVLKDTLHSSLGRLMPKRPIDAREMKGLRND